jgi:uncharacterized membrane protein
MKISRGFFAGTMIGLGVLGLIEWNFTPTWSGVPNAMPARTALALLCAVVSLGSGLALLVERSARAASQVLAACFLIWLLLVRVTQIVVAPGSIDAWWGAGDTAVMLAAAWILWARFAGDREGQRLESVSGERGVRIARRLYGLALIPWGIAHFAYLERTVSLVPTWLPWRDAWAYGTGCAFIAAGLAILVGVGARLAAVLSTLQLGLFTLIVWVPVVVRGPDAFQWIEFVDSWALTAGAWVVADSY